MLLCASYWWVLLTLKAAGPDSLRGASKPSFYQHHRSPPWPPRQKQVAGTLGFLAPEGLRRERQTPKADIFSLGVCLFELCELRSPFGIGVATEASVEARLRGWGAADAAVAAAALFPRYSRELQGLVERMLQVGQRIGRLGGEGGGPGAVLGGRLAA